MNRIPIRVSYTYSTKFEEDALTMFENIHVFKKTFKIEIFHDSNF